MTRDERLPIRGVHNLSESLTLNTSCPLLQLPIALMSNQLTTQNYDHNVRLLSDRLMLSLPAETASHCSKKNVCVVQMLRVQGWMSTDNAVSAPLSETHQPPNAAAAAFSRPTVWQLPLCVNVSAKPCQTWRHRDMMDVRRHLTKAWMTHTA